MKCDIIALLAGEKPFEAQEKPSNSYLTCFVTSQSLFNMNYPQRYNKWLYWIPYLFQFYDLICFSTKCGIRSLILWFQDIAGFIITRLCYKSIIFRHSEKMLNTFLIVPIKYMPIISIVGLFSFYEFEDILTLHKWNLFYFLISWSQMPIEKL